MSDFRRLVAWQEAHRLALATYRATKGFPVEERYGLTSQLRRAAISVPTNIAEACGRRSAGDRRRFLEIAAGSASELDYLSGLAHELGYLSASDFALQVNVVRRTARLLSGLLRPPTTSHQRPATP